MTLKAVRTALVAAVVLMTGPAGAQDNRQVVLDLNGSVAAEKGAILRGLDRMNGTIVDIEIAPGQRLVYERLEIELVECRYPEAQRETEAFAHLKVRDLREEIAMFVGWMFASSPALSALDHPRYDVWVLRCNT